ncbi:MAG TPA: tetratricopeptide repeat protein [Flavobacteriales bacterium]|nr:tetratricopeptide repeat protein [Flavobacteriales bacterium]
MNQRKVVLFLLFCLAFIIDSTAGQTKKQDSLLLIIKKAKTDTNFVNASNELATMLLGIDDEKAKEYALKSLYVSRKLKNKKLEGWCLNLAGLAYDYLARPDSALFFYQQSIKIKKKIGDTDGMASSYLNIGVLYLYQNDFDKAIVYYEKSLTLYKKTNNEKRIAGVYNNMGSVYRQQKKYAQALKMYELAYALKVRVKDSTGISNALGNMGIVYQHLGDYKKAGELMEKSLEIDKMSHNTYNYISSCISLGELKLYMRDLPASQKYLDTAILLGKKVNAVHALDDAYKVYTTIDSLRGDFKAAYEHLRLYYAYKAIVVKEENTRDLNKLEIAYNTREKEQEIVLLNANAQISNLKIQKQNRQLTWFIIFSVLLLAIVVLIFFGYRSIRKSRIKLTLQNKIIQESLEEKEILLKEIHHRVKNNLQVISSLLSIQSRYITDEKALEAINESKDRVSAISLLHQEIYKNEVLKTIRADEYVHALAKGLQQTFDPKESTPLHIDTQSVLMDVDQLIPLGLILNELLTNAYKYASGAGNNGIAVTLRVLNAQVMVSVHDNGPGIAVGFDLNSTKSLGFKLVHMLTQKLKGGITFENKEGLLVSLVFSAKS